MTWDKVKEVLDCSNYSLFGSNINMTLELFDENYEYMQYGTWRISLLGNQSVSFDMLIAECNEYYSECVKIIQNYTKIAEYFEDIAAAIKDVDISLADILANDETCIRWIMRASSVFDKINIVKYINYDVAIGYLQKYLGTSIFTGRSINHLMYRINIFRMNVSKNPHIKYALIKDSLYKWDLRTLVSNPALTIVECLEIVHENGSSDRKLVKHLVYHPFLTADVVLANPDLDWSAYYLQHSRYLYDVDVNGNSFESKYSVGDRAMVKYNAAGSSGLLNDEVEEVEYYNKKLNQNSVYITWADIMAENVSNINDICCNEFRKNRKFRMVYVARRYFDRWRINARHAIVVRENKAVYECCVHELKMRFRDVERVVVI